MSRTNEVKQALSYVRDGIEGGCLVDYRHKSTISWTLDTLAAEVERLEAEHIGAMAAITAASRAAGQERTRAETAEARVKELEAQNARLRAALERLDALYISEFDHEDRPPRPQWLQAALNSEEAST